MTETATDVDVLHTEVAHLREHVARLVRSADAAGRLAALHPAFEERFRGSESVAGPGSGPLADS